MMRRVTFCLGVALAVAGVALWQSVEYGLAKREECARLAANQTALLSDMAGYRVRDSLQAAGVAALTLKASEMERHFAPLASLVRDMGVRIKRLESVAQNAVESRYAIEIPLRDTVVLATAAQVLHYDDGHLSLDGMIREGGFRGVIVSRDTLTQAVHRIPRRFLFLRWGTRELRQEIVSSNPHSRITYSRYLKIDDSRR